MKNALLLTILTLGLANFAAAQNIVLGSGRVVPTQGVSMKDGNIIAKVERIEQGKPVIAEVPVPLAQVKKIDFPVPPELAQAQDLSVQGKNAEAIALLKKVLDAQEQFREVPGNWWDKAALLTTQMYLQDKKDVDADGMARKLVKSVNPEMVHAANVQLAAVNISWGVKSTAESLIEKVLKESKDAAPRAGAYIIRGDVLLKEEKYEDALYAYMQVPVFYPSEKILLPAALLGRGRAHLGMDDLADARAALEELRRDYPATAAAKAAEEDLKRVADLEKDKASEPK